jgi:hypothetical protein
MRQDKAGITYRHRVRRLRTGFLILYTNTSDVRYRAAGGLTPVPWLAASQYKAVFIPPLFEVAGSPSEQTNLSEHFEESKSLRLSDTLCGR